MQLQEPPQVVIDKMQSVRENFERTEITSSTDKLLGFLWRYESDLVDVMYVSKEYKDKTPDLSAEWPFHKFYPIESMDHSPW